MPSTTNIFGTVRAAIGVFVPGAGPATTLIAALIEVDGARDTQLDRLERKVDDLRDQPWRQGLSRLREARDVPGREQDSLREALGDFKEAHTMYQREPEVSFWAAWSASTVSYALGESNESRYWIMQTREDAVGAITQQCERADQLTAGAVTVRSINVRNVVGLIVFAAVAAIIAVTQLPSVFEGAGGFFGLAAALIGLGFLVSLGGWLSVRAGAAAAAVADVPLESRFNKRVVALRELARCIDEIEETALTFGVDPTAIERYTLKVTPDRTISYLPTAATAGA